MVLTPRLEQLRDQHDLMVSVLRQAGGVDAETAVPAGSTGKIADVVFVADRLIAEVKSLTFDRRTSPAVQERLGTMIHKGAVEHGGPIIFGTVSMTTDQLPPTLASRALREIGDRVLKEVREANKQIGATAEKLGWQDYKGVVAFVAPPNIMRRDVIGWLVSDALKDGKYPCVNCLVIGSTPYLSGPGTIGDSFLSFHGRGGFEIPLPMKRRIGMAWAGTHGQPWREMSPDDWGDVD